MLTFDKESPVLASRQNAQLGVGVVAGVALEGDGRVDDGGAGAPRRLRHRH